MAVCGCSFSRVVVAIALIFIGYNAFTIYSIFNPPQCTHPGRCIPPKYTKDSPLDLWVYSSSWSSAQSSIRGMSLVFHGPVDRADSFKKLVKKTVNLTLPKSTLNNGSLYAHVFLGPKGKSPSHPNEIVHMSASVVPLTQYSVLQSTSFNLLFGSGEEGAVDQVVSHWIPWLAIHCLEEDFVFDAHLVPPDLVKSITVAPHTRPAKYLPILYVDRLRVRQRELQPLSPANNTVALELSYSPLPIGRLRLTLLFAMAMDNMRALGFTEKEFEDVKGLILDTNFWLFGLTVIISIFHLLFDFLAFKNDINFWRHRKTTVGLSTTTILWRCVSQTIVFLYLLEEKTSLLVTIPSGIATIIEYWKVLRAFKAKLAWRGYLPVIERGERVQSEVETDAYDSQAMKKLSYLLYPLVLAGAVYQLIYSSHRSWYSWLINSLVNGVYAFGFLFMLPQLFLNYKLKSVAHLPWRAFMYKAFNTFIDDVFAFIIVMPTAHRIAVFRDDLVFLVYLYQRWLYPVDKSRVNEYGESFATEHKQHQD